MNDVNASENYDRVTVVTNFLIRLFIDERRSDEHAELSMFDTAYQASDLFNANATA